MTPIQNCILNKNTKKVPIWLMRQAGRYMSEFRQIRKENPDIIKLCLNEKLSSEITLQPIKKFRFDAAIIFSDILMVPYATNQEVRFEKGFGPRLGDLNINDINNTNEEDFTNKLNPIYKAITLTSKDDLLKASIDGMSVEEKLLEQTGVIGEKIQINQFVKINAPYVGSYIHAGNKIATIVGLSNAGENMNVISKDIAMQVAAMNPIALNEDSVDSATIEKEIEIAKDQLRAEGKPEEMLDNIAKGKLKRFFKDNTLINQAFIKDSKISVAQYLSSFDESLTISSFKRVSIG